MCGLLHSRVSPTKLSHSSVCILTTYFTWVKRMILSIIKHVILNGNPHQLLDVSQGTDGSGKERLGKEKCYNL